MPYQDHACRLEDPDNYSDSRLAENEREHEGKKYHVLYGKRKSDGEWEDQSYRYPTSTWPESDARSHCGEHDGEFHPAQEGEDATGKPPMQYALPEAFQLRLADAPLAITASGFVEMCRRASDTERRPQGITTVEHHPQGPVAQASHASLDLPRADGTVAVVPIYGVIERNRIYWGDAFTEDIALMLADFVRRDDIGAVVLDIDSPGGVVYGTPELADQIRAARSQKPIYAVTGGDMASAAYWIGSAATKVFAGPSAQVGSIGVWSAHLDASKALDEIGLKITLVSAGKYKTEGNMFEPLGDEAREAMQAKVDGYYEQFVAAVARNRGRRESTVRGGFGEGRMLLAAEALAEKMIDGIATLGQLLSRIVPRKRGSRQASALADLAIEEAQE